jgi:hypothetical protein
MDHLGAQFITNRPNLLILSLICQIPVIILSSHDLIFTSQINHQINSITSRRRRSGLRGPILILADNRQSRRQTLNYGVCRPIQYQFPKLSFVFYRLSLTVFFNCLCRLSFIPISIQETKGKADGKRQIFLLSKIWYN